VRFSNDSTYALAKLGHGYAAAGKRDEVHGVLVELNVLSEKRYVSAYDVAMIYVGLQDHAKAFAWLERAFEQRSLWLGYLNVEPQLDRLRSDSGFQELIWRVGLSQKRRYSMTRLPDSNLSAATCQAARTRAGILNELRREGFELFGHLF